MVGYDPESSAPSLTPFEFGVAGFCSGACTRALLQPLDVVKIRLQLQVEPIKRGGQGKYEGVRHSACLIWKEEGLRALWKGHVPAQGLSIVFGVVQVDGHSRFIRLSCFILHQFVSFELLTKVAWHSLPSEWWTDGKPGVDFLCGSCAGALAMTAALPLDVIRTRLVAQGKTKVHGKVSGLVWTMLTVEGPGSFYRGFLPTVVQIAPYTGLQFAFYSSLCGVWGRLGLGEGSDSSGPGRSLVCGAVAGIGAKVAIYPFDLLKKRLQMIGFEASRASFGQFPHYNGLNHCVKTILKQEGIFGLYKGLTASVLKAATSTGLSFLFYEQCCRLMQYGTSRF